MGDLGGYLGNRRGDRPYPPLESRRAAARAYIATCPPEVLSACSRTDVDEVVYDMEIGRLFWMLRIAGIVKHFKMGFIHPLIIDTIQRSIPLLQRGKKTDLNLQQRILQKGVTSAATNCASISFTICKLLQCCLCCGWNGPGSK